MMLRQKKTGPVRGCLIPFATLVGVLALCYVFCFVLFTLNNAGNPNFG